MSTNAKINRMIDALMHKEQESPNDDNALGVAGRRRRCEEEKCHSLGLSLLLFFAPSSPKSLFMSLDFLWRCDRAQIGRCVKAMTFIGIPSSTSSSSSSLTTKHMSAKPTSPISYSARMRQTVGVQSGVVLLADETSIVAFFFNFLPVLPFFYCAGVFATAGH